MNRGERRQYNDAILEKLDFERLLADVQTENDPQKRSNALAYSFCHMLYQQRTSGRSFDLQWILENIGDPAEEWTEANGEQTLLYCMASPCLRGVARQVANGTLKRGRLAGFARSQLLQQSSAGDSATQADAGIEMPEK